MPGCPACAPLTLVSSPLCCRHRDQAASKKKNDSQICSVTSQTFSSTCARKQYRGEVTHSTTLTETYTANRTNPTWRPAISEKLPERCSGSGNSGGICQVETGAERPALTASVWLLSVLSDFLEKYSVGRPRARLIPFLYLFRHRDCALCGLGTQALHLHSRPSPPRWRRRGEILVEGGRIRRYTTYNLTTLLRYFVTFVKLARAGGTRFTEC